MKSSPKRRVPRPTKKAKARKPKPSIETSRERIRAAALRLFAKYGYEGVGLQRIADEVGLHKSSLFHHYRGKVDLAREVFDDTIERVAERVEPLVDDKPPQLQAFIDVVFDLDDHFCDNPDTARALMSVITAPDDSDLRVPMEHSDHPVVRFYAIVLDWLERARRSGAIRPVNIRQTLYNLIGAVLFYPATAESEPELCGPEPFSAKNRKHRKRELGYLLRGALAPD